MISYQVEAFGKPLAQALRDTGDAVIGLSLTRHVLIKQKLGGAWATRAGGFPTRPEALAP